MEGDEAKYYTRRVGRGDYAVILTNKRNQSCTRISSIDLLSGHLY